MLYDIPLYIRQPNQEILYTATSPLTRLSQLAQILYRALSFVPTYQCKTPADLTAL